MAHVARHDANITCHVIKRARIAFGGEDGDACATFDEERPAPTVSVAGSEKSSRQFHIPLIGIWVPVHLTHRTRFDIKMASGDRLGDWEVLAVHDACLATAPFVRGRVEHVVCVLVLGLLERGRRLFLNALWYRTWEMRVS